MKVDVIMPQMGESIQEGTVVRWIKKVGDIVKRDEPILEISTDKVDAEIPSPAAGVLMEIKVDEGQTVEIKTVLATIESEAGAVAEASKSPSQGSTAASVQETADRGPAPAGRAVPSLSPRPEALPSPAPRTASSLQERRRLRSSPLVRKIAHEHGVDIGQLTGTGVSGRVTKNDILAYLERRGDAASPAPVPSVASFPAFAPGERVRVEPLSVMRKKIALHMVESKQTSAHVHTFFEVDYTQVEKIRQGHKETFRERHGAKLTYLPFILQAVVEALKAWPVLNASVEGDKLAYKKDINLGVAVALDWGLIVPVIKNAEELSLAGLAKAAQDLAERARTKKLLPEEVQAGTFTVTNPGVFGSLFGTPIINQPQLAILGVGTIEKRLKIIEDSIAIRTMGYLALGFDHRIVDGAVADQFMSHIVKALESFDANVV